MNQLINQYLCFTNKTPNPPFLPGQFVDVDGTIEFTDQFGREVEVRDAFGRDALEIPGLEEQQELQQQQFQLERRRAQLMAELATLNRFAGPGVGAAAGPAAGAGGAAAANRFRIVV